MDSLLQIHETLAAMTQNQEELRPLTCRPYYHPLTLYVPTFFSGKRDAEYGSAVAHLVRDRLVRRLRQP